MNFLLDMGISPGVMPVLRGLGHNASHLHVERLHRLTDSQILDKARAEGAIVLTHDLDFGTLLAASREALPSVIIFRLADMRPENVGRHLLSIIARYADDLERGALLSVNERRVRLRPLPIS